MSGRCEHAICFAIAFCLSAVGVMLLALAYVMVTSGRPLDVPAVRRIEAIEQEGGR